MPIPPAILTGLLKPDRKIRSIEDYNPSGLFLNTFDTCHVYSMWRNEIKLDSLFEYEIDTEIDMKKLTAVLSSYPDISIISGTR